MQVKNCICGKAEFTNHLTWDASKTSTVVSYLIKRNGEEIGKVSAKKPLVFDDVDQPPVRTKYEVIAVDETGLESKPAVVVVKGYGD